MISSFTQKKFLRLQEEQRHKYCSICLKNIYEALLEKKDPSFFLQEYNQYLGWIKEKPFTTFDYKNLADQYHYHLKKAKIHLKEHNLLPNIRTGDSEAKKPFSSNAIFLDNIRSAYNVGSILRTVEALRMGAVHFAKKTPYIDNPKVKKISMHSVDKVSCSQNTDYLNLPRPIIIADTSKQAISLYEYIFPDSFTLVMGNEEYGVSDESLHHGDYIIEIPLFGSKNSINVACAFSIIASEWQRQHLQKEKIYV
jgi:tRNA G18 (ribose-2'-O)-methylase SpoU